MKITDEGDLGRLVRERRRAAGLTQAQAAELMGVGRRLLVELERGERAASIGTVLRILQFLGLELRAEPRSLP